MILRHYITCDTCNHAHTLRIQVGHQPYQEHTFQCCDCEEDIVLGMDCQASTASAEVRHIQNCSPGNKEGSIVNLSPDFPIAKEDLHRDLAFPSIKHTDALLKKQQSLGVSMPQFASAEEMLAFSRNAKGPNELWPVLKKGWSLSSKGKIDIAGRVFKEYRPGEFSDPLELKYILFDFSTRMLMPSRISLFEDAAEEISRISQKHGPELRRFVSFYKSNLHDENLERYFEVFKEYFACFSDFSQTLTHVQYDIPLPGNCEASSNAFSKSKLFYGNAYEALTSNVTVLACINNVGKGRPFDQFENMDLKKYLTINKANRCNPFQSTEPFNAIGRSLESTVRNASHHGGMKLTNRGKTIQYRSGGTGAQRTMSYLSYITHCNEIMISCCALLAMELALAF